MEKVLITGATGMLGGYVYDSIDKKKYKVFAPNRSELNLKDTAKLTKTIKEISPDIILHLAAETNVDLCEVDIRHAMLVNCLATEAIAKAAKEVGAWTIYISTSNVFGARGQLVYNELDLPDPVNYYGRSKLFGEEMVKKYLPDSSLIIRAGWMMGGGSARDQKFVGKIIAQIKNGAAKLRAVDDKYGTVTLASALSAFILRSMEQKRVGICHFASKGLVTRFSIASIVTKCLNFSGGVSAAKSSEFPLSAPRSDSEGLESLLLTEEDGIGFVDDDIKKYLTEFI